MVIAMQTTYEQRIQIRSLARAKVLGYKYVCPPQGTENTTVVGAK